MDLSFDNICRICLNYSSNMIPIFDSTYEASKEVSICMKIVLCCQLEVATDDGLPHQICHECNTDLKKLYGFRELALASDNTLRKFIRISDNYVENEGCIIKCERSNVSPAQCGEPILLNGEQNIPTKKKPSVLKKSRKKLKAANKASVGKEFSCPECGKSFGFQCLLRDHLVSHTGDKPFLCSVCGKSFGYIATLSSHMKTHGAEKKYKCDMCELSFHRRGHLTLHKRTHTGEKPFPCNFCSKSFAQKSYLKEHVRIHSGEKPFVCETCGHGFARKSSLTMHIRIHTGELPYPCPDCSRSFSQRSQRKRHVLSKHKGTPALRENGELILREHDQLRTILSKIEDVEANSVPTATYANGSFIHYTVVDLP